MRRTKRKLYYLLVAIVTHLFVIPALAQKAGDEVQVTTTPAVVELTLNDLFRFDRPGKYTVQVKTSRVSRPERPHDHVPVINLTTNEVSFEVVAMSDAEEEQEIRRLSKPLDEIRDWKEEARISEELSFLAGEASTREKAQRYLSSQSRSGNYIQNIRFGLFIARDSWVILPDTMRHRRCR